MSHLSLKINIKKDDKMGNALLYNRYRVDLGHRVGHCNDCVKFESSDRYYCIRKTILNEDYLSA